MELESIKNSFILYEKNYTFYIKDYYNYVVKLLRKVLTNNDYKINVSLIYHNNIANNNKNIIIGINFEHTLVKIGGRSAENSLPGNISNMDSDEKYLVRIDGYHNLINKNIIIDYSIPNLININKSLRYVDYYNKCIHISALLYKPYYNIENRNIKLLTTFINTNEPRRFRLLENIKNKNMEHTNINNCFEKKQLKALYRNTKIIINIHQTDHHHTFEELRVLPALLNGVIVIAENSPLYESIPYYKHVIWSSYDNILDKVIEVENNYEDYYKKIFNEEFLSIVKKLEIDNYNNLNYKLQNIV
jgi:hypothetical protein